MKMLIRTNSRNRKGNFLAEAPGVIGLILLALFFPMVDYCSLGIRASLVFSACNQATLTASKARSYEVGSTDAPSAKDLAQSTAQLCSTPWQGIHLISTSTKIVTTNINTQVQTKQSGKLTSPPNTADNTFQLEVTLTADVDPLINVPFFANIPGISAPYRMVVVQRNYFENSQGLMR